VYDDLALLDMATLRLRSLHVRADAALPKRYALIDH
jgi:hypothetical protein